MTTTASSRLSQDPSLVLGILLCSSIPPDHPAPCPNPPLRFYRTIQDVAEQGVVFAGFLQQPGTGLSLTGQWDPGEELSSLHSSPSPIHRHGFSPSEGPPSGKSEAGEGPRGEPGSVEEELMNSTGSETGAESSESPVEEPPHWTGSEPDQNHSSHNNNHLSSLKSQQQDQGRDQDGDRDQDRERDQERDRDRDEQRSSSSPGARWQLFALYNHSEESDPSLRFYSLRVPLQVHREAGLITQLDGHWLDHMTQHFSSGAQLVDGFFHVEEERDSGVALVDGIFIFQSSAESVSASYDAIVVEQWTVVDGVVVKADYIPLLQSLAPFGWRLMCVLPTPIVKTNSDGSLSTKQILFLQRPVLPRRRRDFKPLSCSSAAVWHCAPRMNLKSRNKARRSGATRDLCEESCPSLLEMERLPRRPEEAPSQLQTQHQLQQHQHQAKVFFLSPQSREEETDVDAIHTTKQQYLVHSSVRWTDVCHKETRSPAQEPAKSQLFSGVC
uniref:Raftlin-like n=1 Tax=Knipowitschia caucasica TaxID=637954 RepID=A0AAV2K579_KNICA